MELQSGTEITANAGARSGGIYLTLAAKVLIILEHFR